MALSSSLGEGARVLLGARGEDECCAHTRTGVVQDPAGAEPGLGIRLERTPPRRPGGNRVWGQCRGGDSAQQRLMTNGLVAGLAPGRQ